MTGNSPRSENPLTTSIEKLRQELDQMLELARTKGEQAMDAFGFREGSRAWTPLIDVLETTEEVVVAVDLPGVSPDTIDITLAGNMLTLKGEKPAVAKTESDVLHSSERRSGAFSRSIPLPVPVDQQAVSAESNHGVLTIRLPKAERAKPQHIKVNVAGQPAGGSAPPEPGAG